MTALAFGTLADTAEDAAAFCALSNALYARPVDAAYYRWQFHETPFPTHLVCARDEDGRLVGCLAVQVRDLVPEGRAGWVVDIMVRPDLQGQGVFRQLEGHAAATVEPRPDTLAVMANDKAAPASVRLGWAATRVFTTFARATAAPLTPPRSLVAPLARFSDAAGVLEAWRDGVAGTGGARLRANRRTAAYLDWRFMANPRYAYERFHVRRPGSGEGLLVLKVFRDPVSGRAFGDVVDAVWTEPDPGLLEDMLAFAVGFFRERGVPEAAVWLQTGTAFDDAGLRVGFAPTGQRRNFLTRASTRAFADAATWFLSMADSEVY